MDDPSLLAPDRRSGIHQSRSAADGGLRAALLEIVALFVTACQDNGLSFERWAEPLYLNFERLQRHLTATDRMDEDAPTKPTPCIDLEAL